MPATTSGGSTGYCRRHYELLYQDAGHHDGPDGPVLRRCFRTEDDAHEWADASFVVPLGINEVDQLLGDDGRALGTRSRFIEY